MKVLFLSTFRFPSGDAGSLRNLFLSKLFAKNGYTPYFIGKGETSIGNYTKNEYGFYTSLRSKNRNAISRALDTLFLFERKLVAEVKRIVEPKDIVVIASFFSKATNKRILDCVKKKGGKVVFSIEEKHTKSQFEKKTFFSMLGLRKCNSFYANIAYYNKPIIAISSYLGDYAKRAGVPYVVIPFVYDEDLEIPTNRLNDAKKTRFFYSGTPGNKDLLWEMIKGFDHLDAEHKSRIEVNVFGVDEAFAKKKLPPFLWQATRPFLNFHGTVGRDKIHSEIACSDYSILLRNDCEEFAKAGFPTKVVESLFFGIPVVTNLTSDLGHYLKDFYNAVIAKGYDYEAFAEAVRAAVDVPPEKLLELKKNARNTCLSSLTAKAFEEPFHEFLSRI